MGPNRVTPRSEREAIDALRILADHPVGAGTSPQTVRLVVDLLAAAEFRDTIAARTGLSPDQLMELVVEFGTWLGQSRRGAGAPALAPHEAGRLFAVAHDGGQILVPHGFEPKLAGRDVSRAVANIVAAAPDDALITRFVIRRDHQVVIPLTWGYVSTVHVVAQLGRLDEFEDLARRDAGKPNVALARVVVEAFDLLDVAREDAVKAVKYLTGLASGAFDRAAFERSVTAVEWVGEREARRLGRLADIDETAVRKEVTALAQAVAVDPARWAPARVGDLTGAHVLRIAQRAGIDTAASYREEENEARTAIAAAGLRLDLDQLLGVGVQALRAGLGDVFATALTRRATGDLDWAEDLNAALSAH